MGQTLGQRMGIYSDLLIVPTDHELLGSMMSRLAQAEQQLKAAQTQLLEKVKKKHCKYLLQ